MSFSEKLMGFMARPGENEIPKDDIPWYMRYGAQALGIVAAFFAVLFGFFNCFGVVTINLASVISGILEILVGVFVMAIEAPICCMFVDFVQDVAKAADSRPYWNRAALYCIIALPPVLIFPSLASVFGCGLVFCTGILYGMMSIGKKASLDQMRTAATTDNRNGGRSNNLVNNAQPISFTGPPPFDSNV